MQFLHVKPENLLLDPPFFGPKLGIYAQEMGRYYIKITKHLPLHVKYPYEHFLFCVCRLLVQFFHVKPENLLLDPRFWTKTGNLCPGNGQVLHKNYQTPSIACQIPIWTLFVFVCWFLVQFSYVKPENVLLDPHFRTKTGNLCPGNGQVLHKNYQTPSIASQIPIWTLCFVYVDV